MGEGGSEVGWGWWVVGWLEQLRISASVEVEAELLNFPLRLGWSPLSSIGIIKKRHATGAKGN